MISLGLQAQINPDYRFRPKETETKPTKDSNLADSTLTPQYFSIDLIKNSFFLLRQDYSLYDKRKKKFYGYNDQGKFGTTYSIGIKCKGFNSFLRKCCF